MSKKSSKKRGKVSTSGSKLGNIKVLVIAIIVIGSGAVIVVTQPKLVNDLTNIITGNHSTPVNQTLTNNTNLLAQTASPPFSTQKYNLAGGNQYADLHFTATVPDSYSDTYFDFTNIAFKGTITNMTEALSNPSTNRVDQITLHTDISSCKSSQNFSSNTNNGIAPPPQSSAVTAGDINGHGQDQYIAAFFTACNGQVSSKLSVLNFNATSNSFDTWYSADTGLYYPQVTTADLMGTGINQVIVGGFTSPTTTNVTIKIFNFAPLNVPVLNAHAVQIENFTIPNTNLTADTQFVLDKGNPLGTFNQQFLIYGQSTNSQYTCTVFNYNKTLTGSKKLSIIASWTDSSLGRPVFGKVLYNSHDQIIFPNIAGVTSVTNESGFIYDFVNQTVVKDVYFPHAGIIGVSNFNGDGQSYIAVLGAVYHKVYFFQIPASYTLKDAFGNYNDINLVNDFTSDSQYCASYSIGIASSNCYGPYNAFDKIYHADLNFDGIPELVYQDGYAGRFMMYRGNRVGFNDHTINSIDYYTPNGPMDSSIFTSSSADFYYNSYQNGMTVGNFYNQSVLATYKYQNWLSEGKPSIVTVLAAPPTKKGISQNYATSETSWGQTNTQSQSQESSFGYTVGGSVTVGFGTSEESDAPSWEGSIGFSFDYGSTTSHKTERSVEFSNTWTTDAEHNGVIYSATKYNNWNYTILDSTNPHLNGKTVTYSFPYFFQIYKVDADVFDQEHPGYNINTGTFGNQTLGSPNTYPSQSKATLQTSSNADDFMAPSLHQVGQGGAGDEQEIVYGSVTSNSQSHDYTIGESASYKYSFGAGFSVEAEFSSTQTWGSTAEVSIGKDTLLSGRVGQISNVNDYNKWDFGFGLYGYLLNRTDLGGVQYYVVNYYTGDFGLGYKSTTTSSSTLPTIDIMCLVDYPEQDLLKRKVDRLLPANSLIV